MPKAPRAAGATRDFIVSRLNRLLDDALESARLPHLGVHLELYSGKSFYAKKLRASGLAVVAFDIQYGPEFNLNNKFVQRTILGWIEGNLISTVWLGTPCISWSYGLNRWPKHRVRTTEHLWGLPNLTGEQQQKVVLGNQQARFSFLIIRKCTQLRIAVFLENPARSLLFQTKAFLKLASHPTCVCNTLSMCAFGAPWHKLTKVYTWHCESSSLSRRCCGKNGYCSFTGAKHIQLSGHSAKHKIPWTAVAAAYPQSFATVAAKIAISAAHDRYTSIIAPFFLGESFS